MAQHLAVGERALSTATRHLIHRPKSAAHFLLNSRSTQEERFALAGEMPYDHPLFNDGLGQVHDPQIFVDIVRNVGSFVGRRYFRIPLDRLCRFDSVEFALPTPAAWRVGESPAQMAMDVSATPTPVTTGVPGGLRLDGTLAINGVASCTGHAELRFLAPDPHHHRMVGRPWARARGLGYGLPPASPHTVGRCDPRNVVVSTPTNTDDTLSTQLLVDSGHPVFFSGNSEVVPGLLLVEAVRQTSILTATRTHGFSALHTCLTRLSVRFPDNALPELPLTCTAQAESVGDDRDEKPSVRIHSKIEQLDRVVAEATVTLAHAV